MLSQLERLSLEVDGRYASDAELQFLTDYIQSFGLRVQTYQKLQELETVLLQHAYSRVRSLDPNLLRNSGNEDLTARWQRDTTRVLRYIAVAVLLNDSDTMQERCLLWFQTVIRSFNLERHCNLTYNLLQEAVKQHLTAPQANLVCPLLELSGRILGTTA